MHGAVIAPLFNSAGAHAGVICAAPEREQRAMKISLNVNPGDNVKQSVLIAKARVQKAEKTIFVSSFDAEDANGNLLATGEVLCHYSSGSHLSKGITEGLGPSDT